MTFPLVLGWTASFDEAASTLHLSTANTTRAATISFAAPPEGSGDDLLARATNYMESEIHRRGREGWSTSRGRLAIGGRGLVEARSSGPGELHNGSARGLFRRLRTGRIVLGDRAYDVRHRSRWRAVVRHGEEEIATLTRRVGSRRSRPLDRTRMPQVRTSVVSEADQLAVVLAATVLGPPGRTGFWGGLAGEVSVLP